MRSSRKHGAGTWAASVRIRPEDRPRLYNYFAAETGNYFHSGRHRTVRRQHTDVYGGARGFCGQRMQALGALPYVRSVIGLMHWSKQLRMGPCSTGTWAQLATWNHRRVGIDPGESPEGRSTSRKRTKEAGLSLPSWKRSPRSMLSPGDSNGVFYIYLRGSADLPGTKLPA